MKRFAFLGLIIIMSLAVVHLQAQNKKKKKKEKKTEEKVPTFNYVIDDPMDKFGPGRIDSAKKPAVTILKFTAPEFYSPRTKIIGDTTLEFLCYDVRDSLIPVVNNYDSVRYFSLFKKYIDPAHTYTDNNGEKKPLPVSSISKRYDRLGKDKWMSIEYPGNKYTELRAFKNVIVNTDTLTAPDPATGSSVMRIYSYYKVIKN